MKYKTLFRVLLKVIGVWLFVQGIIGTLSNVGSFILLTAQFSRTTFTATSTSAFYQLWYMLGPIAQLGIGLYLLLGGKWIADVAIPGNRPYCHECGYDLTGAVGDRCNECGTPFRTSDTADATRSE